MRDTAKKVMEIGVETDRSIRMWEEYFPNAEIIGIDISEQCREFEGDRRRIFIGDQLDPDFLHRVVAEIGADIDIIIDDGLHTPRAMMTSFANLFPALKRGGVYVVEDIISQPHTVEFFSNLAHKVNHWPTDHSSSDYIWMPPFVDQDWLTQNVVGVAVYRYIAFVTRGANPEDNPQLISKEIHMESKRKLIEKINTTIDEMLAEGLKPDPYTVAERAELRGSAIVKTELKRRGL